MNDLENLLGSFGRIASTKDPPFKQLSPAHFQQEVFLDILLKSEKGKVLAERWTFTLLIAQEQ